MPHDVFLLLGSNMGDSFSNLEKARGEIGSTCGEIIHESSLYRTAAWGNTKQDDFLNQVIRIQSRLEPIELLNQLLRIESNMGRVRSKKWEPRVIDLDILFYEDLIMDKAELILPHPQLYLRRFTLIPLCEIAAQYVHPVLQKTMQELLEACPDESHVEKWGSKS